MTIPANHIHSVSLTEQLGQSCWARNHYFLDGPILVDAVTLLEFMRFRAVREYKV